MQLFNMLILIAAFTGHALSIPLSLPSNTLFPSSPIAPRGIKEQETDRLLFQTSMENFLSAKARKTPNYLNWSDNGCTIVPDRPAGFNFLDACKRHDFGYANYKIQKRCSENQRGQIDENFKKDMYKECAKYSGWQAILGVRCRVNAEIYFKGVRAVGEKFFC